MKFLAIITTPEGCDYAPGCGEYVEEIEADTFAGAWGTLIANQWGDYDPRLGGVEDPRTAVKNAEWMPIQGIRMVQVLAEEDSTYFDAWYTGACAAYERKERSGTEESERALLEKLKRKYE